MAIKVYGASESPELLKATGKLKNVIIEVPDDQVGKFSSSIGLQKVGGGYSGQGYTAKQIPSSPGNISFKFVGDVPISSLIAGNPGQVLLEKSNNNFVPVEKFYGVQEDTIQQAEKQKQEASAPPEQQTIPTINDQLKQSLQVKGTPEILKKEIQTLSQKKKINELLKIPPQKFPPKKFLPEETVSTGYLNQQKQKADLGLFSEKVISQYIDPIPINAPTPLQSISLQASKGLAKTAITAVDPAAVFLGIVSLPFTLGNLKTYQKAAEFVSNPIGSALNDIEGTSSFLGSIFIGRGLKKGIPNIVKELVSPKPKISSFGTGVLEIDNDVALLTSDALAFVEGKQTPLNKGIKVNSQIQLTKPVLDEFDRPTSTFKGVGIAEKESPFFSFLLGNGGKVIKKTVTESEGKVTSGKKIPFEISKSSSIQSIIQDTDNSLDEISSFFPSEKLSDVEFNGIPILNKKIKTAEQKDAIRYLIRKRMKEKFPFNEQKFNNIFGYPPEPIFKKGGDFFALEPQVADAVINIQNKGYATSSSGFTPNSFDIHILIEGDHKTIKNTAESLGLKVRKEGLDQTQVSINLKGKSLLEIKNKLDDFSKKLPNNNPIEKNIEFSGIQKTINAKTGKILIPKSEDEFIFGTSYTLGKGKNVKSLSSLEGAGSSFLDVGIKKGPIGQKFKMKSGALSEQDIFDIVSMNLQEITKTPKSLVSKTESITKPGSFEDLDIFSPPFTIPESGNFPYLFFVPKFKPGIKTEKKSNFQISQANISIFSKNIDNDIHRLLGTSSIGENISGQKKGMQKKNTEELLFKPFTGNFFDQETIQQKDLLPGTDFDIFLGKDTIPDFFQTTKQTSIEKPPQKPQIPPPIDPFEDIFLPPSEIPEIKTQSEKRRRKKRGKPDRDFLFLPSLGGFTLGLKQRYDPGLISGLEVRGIPQYGRKEQKRYDRAFKQAGRYFR